MNSYNKILIIKPSSLGDVIHSLPFLYALKQTFPKASVHWVIARGLESLLAGHPLVDSLFIINKDLWKKISRIHKTFAELINLLTSLRAEKYDLVVDLQGLFRSGIIAASTRSPVILGFDEAREGSRFFYTHRINGGYDIHAVDRYMKIAKFLGCNTDTIEFPLVSSENYSLLKKHSLEPFKYAVFIPGARWDTKRWPAERFGQVARALNYPVVVIGSRSDLNLAETIYHVSPDNVISLVGETTLPELVFVLSKARFVLTNDTGPMHIAAAVKRPVVALFGPTEARKTGPYGEGHIIVTSNSPCSPCFRKTCAHTECMTDITPDQVINLVKSNDDVY